MLSTFLITRGEFVLTVINNYKVILIGTAKYKLSLFCWIQMNEPFAGTRYSLSFYDKYAEKTNLVHKVIVNNFIEPAIDRCTIFQN